MARFKVNFCTIASLRTGCSRMALGLTSEGRGAGSATLEDWGASLVPKTEAGTLQGWRSPLRAVVGASLGELQKGNL